MQRLWALEDDGTNAGCVDSTEHHATSQEKIGSGHSMVPFLALPQGGMSICAGGNSSNHGASCKLHMALHISHIFQVLWSSRTQTQETVFLLLVGHHSSVNKNHNDSLQHPPSGLMGHNPGPGHHGHPRQCHSYSLQVVAGANPAATRSGTPSDRLEH